MTKLVGGSSFLPLGGVCEVPFEVHVFVALVTSVSQFSGFDGLPLSLNHNS